jgi:hypothetical protein
MLPNLTYRFVTYETHVHSTPLGPNFQQVGGVHSEPFKGIF